MNAMREQRVQELSGSSYQVLRDSYNLVRELKGMVDRLHESALQPQGSLSFDQVVGIKLVTDRLYDDLERYMRPECDPDSAYDAAMTESKE